MILGVVFCIYVNMKFIYALFDYIVHWKLKVIFTALFFYIPQVSSTIEEYRWNTQHNMYLPFISNP
jgi:hypothetical protein